MTATPTTSLSYQNFFSATLTADITASSTDIFMDTIPNGSEGFLVIEPDSTSAREVIYYNSKTATKVVCPSAADGRGQDDTTAGAHLTGATVIMAPVAAYFESLQTLFTTSPQGWTSLSGTFTNIVQLGNRSCTFDTSVDQTAVLSKGHRLKLTRGTPAPTQCTSLNGTTQYYSKTSPSGTTFTDDFTVSAWVKLSSYPSSFGAVASRYNGTSGWVLFVETTGQVYLRGYNAGAANVSQVGSYQSIPLNKWVHITGQLDMSTFTASTTTSYIMMDGVDVPATVARSGTNPTALVQAGDLQIGASNAANFFPGKIAQVAIYNAKVTQANIRLTMGQTLTGAETSLISAYSFNNTINDLNGSNANNLTANGSAVATSTDSPFAGGSDIPTGVTAGTIEYGIVTNVTSTTVTCQLPEGYALPTTGTISAGAYSTYKVPYGFPAQRGKWEINWLIKTATLFASGSTNNTWQSGPTNGSLAVTIPIGEWTTSYDVLHYSDRGASVNIQNFISLSTSNSSESDSYWTSYFQMGIGSGSTFNECQSTRTGSLSLSSATPYYLLGKANSSDGTIGNNSISQSGTSNITCTLAYL